MGEKMLKYYKYVADQAGLQGKTRLAIETKIPSTKAALAPDTPANLALFREAVAKITERSAPML